jgi:uncharacterized membrane protein YkoI
MRPTVDGPRRVRATLIGLAVALLLAGCGGTDDSLADSPDEVYGPAITEQEAVDAALARTPGEVVDVVVDADRGTSVFSVVIRRSDGVLVATTVEANTGEVLKAEQLTDDGRVPGDGGPVDSP